MLENNRILIVDDEPAILDAYRDILSPRGVDSIEQEGNRLFGGESTGGSRWKIPRAYGLTLCERGEEGIRAIEMGVSRGEPFALAFVDMSMPGIDGAQTARRMWELDSSLKIVIVTAYSRYSPEDIIDVTHREDILFLRKPFHGAEIRQLARSLTRLWNLERERDFLVEELALAKHRAEVANDVRGAFLNNVNHEIRTPLNGLMGALRLLSGDGAGMRHEMLELALESARRLEELLGDIIDLAALEGGCVRLEPAPMDLAALMGKALEEHRHTARKKGIALTLAPSPAIPPRVIADPAYIKKIVRHLVQNAVKFTDKGEITVKMESNASDSWGKDQVEVRISVLDTGIGLPLGDTGTLFESLTMHDTSFSRKHRGLGAGLSIVSKLARSMEGSVSAENLPTGGAAFHVLLPLRLPAQDALLNRLCSPQHQRSGVLILGDDALGCSILGELVSRMGLRPILAKDRNEAKSKLLRAGQKGEKVCVTFLGMAESGCQRQLVAAGQFTGLSEQTGASVMVFSCQPSAEELERMKEMGIEHYLVKPIRWSVLREVMEQATRPWDQNHGRE